MKNVNSSSSELFSTSSCYCGKGMIGLFALFFLVFINAGKYNLMTLIFNDLCYSNMFMRSNAEDSVD